MRAIDLAVTPLRELNAELHRQSEGGGETEWKVLNLRGRHAVAVGTAVLVAIGDNDPTLEGEYNKLGATAGAYDDWREGYDPAGITTQDPDLTRRLDPVRAGQRLANFLNVMTLELQTIARACGHNHVQNLEPEDLCALTIDAAAMARVPLAGKNWIPGHREDGL